MIVSIAKKEKKIDQKKTHHCRWHHVQSGLRPLQGQDRTRIPSVSVQFKSAELLKVHQLTTQELHVHKKYLPGISSLLSLPISIFELRDKCGLGPSHLQPMLLTQLFELFYRGSTVETHTWSVF